MKLTINREYIPHRDDSKKNVEIFWSKPKDKSNNLLVITIHGHLPDLRVGARIDIELGVFEYFAENGALSVSMSMPGYAGSEGAADYCGPFSTAAVSSIIDYFSNLGMIDPDKVILYGLSRGATVAAMTAARDERVKGVVLVNGLYNMLEGYNDLNDGIRESLDIEASRSEKDLKDRSPFHHVDSINIPTLILHGEQDDIAPFKYAKETYDKALEMNKKNITFKSFKEYGHGIPFNLSCELAGKFLFEQNFWSEPTRPYWLSWERGK